MPDGILKRELVAVLGTDFTAYAGTNLHDVSPKVATFKQAELMRQVGCRAYLLHDAWGRVAGDAKARKYDIAMASPPSEHEIDTSWPKAVAEQEKAAPAGKPSAALFADACFVRTRMHKYLASIGCTPSAAQTQCKSSEPTARLVASLAGLAILLTHHWADGIADEPQAVDKYGRLAPVPLCVDKSTGYLEARYDFWVQRCIEELAVLKQSRPDLASLEERLFRLTAEAAHRDWWTRPGSAHCLTPAAARDAIPSRVCVFEDDVPKFDSNYAFGVTGDHLEWLAAVVKHLLIEGTGIHYDEDELAATVSLAPTESQARIRRPTLGEATHLSEIPEEPDEKSEAAARQLLREVLSDADAKQGPSPLHYALAWHLLRACSMEQGASIAISFCYDRMLERAFEELDLGYRLVLPVADSSWVLVDDNPSPKRGRTMSAAEVRTGLRPDDVWELAQSPAPILIKVLGSPLYDRLDESHPRQRIPIGELALMHALGPTPTEDLEPLLKWAFAGGGATDPLLPAWNRRPVFIGFDAWSSRDRLQYFRILEEWNPEHQEFDERVTANTRGFDTPTKYYEALGMQQGPLDQALKSLIRVALDDISRVLKEGSNPLRGTAKRAKELICD